MALPTQGEVQALRLDFSAPMEEDGEWGGGAPAPDNATPQSGAQVSLPLPAGCPRPSPEAPLARVPRAGYAARASPA